MRRIALLVALLLFAVSIYAQAEEPTEIPTPTTDNPLIC